jgi:superfamily II DNA or RNA helicase
MPAATVPASTKKSRRKKRPTIPRTHKPEGMSLEQWQIGLRREFGRAQKFRLQNLDGNEIFSDYLLANPQTARTYRISIRGNRPGDNHCTCPDFSINTLGTCKHIEFTLAKLERRRGAKATLKAGFRPPFTEIYLRYGANRHLVLRHGAESPSDLTARVADFIDEHNVVRTDKLDQFDDFLEELRKGDHEVRCHEDALTFVAQSRDRRRLQERVDQLFPRGVNDPAWKNLLRIELFPYQRKGALFVARAGRSLLADDMGLGKTIQALAATEILTRAAGIERVLVVTPTSLKHQWKREIEKFTDRSAVVIEGGARSRRAAYADDSFFKITNYETLQTDADLITAWSADLVIIDEAQRIKNWKTRTAKTVKQLQSQHAIVLTGTPLENRLEELHSIVEFVDRYHLGPSFRFLADHQQLDEDGRVVGYRNLSSISKTLEPILLRRTKDQVLTELPKRMEEHLFLPMTPEQMAHHEENRSIVARIVQRWRRTKYLSEADQRRLTCALQNMRMSCNSTYLLDPATDFGTKVDEMMSRLDELLETRDTKVVIFSQWVRSHELLSNRLNERRRKFVLLHGGVPGHKRSDIISRFKDESDCRVFLSTDAGGVGLNLQNASAVLNMDQPWNPAVLEQRIGRVHRLGQTKPVQVMHFVARETIEHSMLDLIRFKRSLFTGVLDGTQDQVFMGGTRLKKFMDGVDAATSAIPVDVRSAPVSAELPQPAPAQDDNYSQLISTMVGLGKSLLENLSQAIAPRTDGGQQRMGNEVWSVENDPSSGKPCLKIPIPSPEILGRANIWLQAVAGALRGSTQTDSSAKPQDIAQR